MDKYDALISKGFSKDNIVSISSHAGANVAIKTILDNYDALVTKGFTKKDIVSVSSNDGGKQAIKTVLDKYDALVSKGFSKDNIHPTLLHNRYANIAISVPKYNVLLIVMTA